MCRPPVFFAICLLARAPLPGTSQPAMRARAARRSTKRLVIVIQRYLYMLWWYPEGTP